jgi:hypothetical protein
MTTTTICFRLYRISSVWLAWLMSMAAAAKAEQTAAAAVALGATMTLLLDAEDTAQI